MPTPGINYGETTTLSGTGVTGVRFVDSQHGYLYGEQLFVTSDGGRTWQQRQPPGLVGDVEIASGATYAMVRDCLTEAACAATYSATAQLYKIDDDGRRFTRVGPPGPVSDGSQLVTRDGTLFLFIPAADPTSTGTPATIWIAGPSGTWQQRTAPCTWFGADPGAMAAWSPTGLAMVCGSSPSAGNQLKTAYASTDAGGHWHQVAELPDTSGYVFDLAAADANTWVLSEARGTIEVTRDGGRTWRDATFNNLSTDGVEGWGRVTFISGTHAVAVPWTLNGSALAISTDAAQSWDLINFPSGR